MPHFTTEHKEWPVYAQQPSPRQFRLAPGVQPPSPPISGVQNVVTLQPRWAPEGRGGSCGQRKKATQGDVGGSVPAVRAAVVHAAVPAGRAWKPRHSPGACTGQPGGHRHREGVFRAPSLSSFQRSQVEILGSFFCFSHICSLLELIYPCSFQSYI